MVGGGSRRDDGPLKIGHGNVFAALEVLKKKKKSDKDPKSKGSSKGPAIEPALQVFWAPTPLTAKSWADVDDDDDYFATTAPPQAVWGLSEQQQNKEDAAAAAIEELQESESEDDDLDEGEYDGEEEHEPQAPVAPDPIVEKPPLVSVSNKDTERQLSKKELKKKEMAELDAVLKELGIDGNTAQDETNDKKSQEQAGDAEKKETAPATSESKGSKKKKSKKEKSVKDVKEQQEQPSDLDNNKSPEEVAAEAEDEDSSMVDVKGRLKKVGTMKKKKSSKEMDAAAKAAAVEAAARSARLAAAKKKEKNHYNQQPVR